MTPLSPQKQKIFDLYSGKGWVCSTAIHFIRDYRKRISELNAMGFEILGMKCDRYCKVQHASNVLMRKLKRVPEGYQSSKNALPSPELEINGMWEELSPWDGSGSGVYHEIYA